MDDSDGSLIAVSYEARAAGSCTPHPRKHHNSIPPLPRLTPPPTHAFTHAHRVKRQMRGKEARAACPDLILIQVPVANKKSNINVYREAGAEVVTVLSRFATACERSSIDEVFLAYHVVTW